MNVYIFRVRTPTPEPPKEPKDEKPEPEATNGEKVDEEEPKESLKESPKESSKESTEAPPEAMEEDKKDEEADEEEKPKDPSVYKLPTFEPLEVNAEGVEKKIRIPEPIKVGLTEDFTFEKVSFLPPSLYPLYYTF